MSDYPKLYYRAGTGQGHMLADKPLKIENKYLCDIQRIEDEAAEKAAIDDGWKDSPAEACAPKPETKPEPAPEPVVQAVLPVKSDPKAGEKQA
jgi:hypothetical protein